MSGIITGSVLGGVLFLLCLSALCVASIYACSHHIHGRPLLPNKLYVLSGHRASKDIADRIFQAGSFSGYHFKDGIWHVSDQCTLTLNPQTDHTLYGKGTDDQGTFIVTGVYSPRTLRMAFDKQYQTIFHDNVSQGDTKSTVQVQWNPATLNFQGKYYFKAAQRSDEGKYVIQIKDPKETYF